MPAIEVCGSNTPSENAVQIAVGSAYLWEFLVTLDFEWSFIRRRKQFTWPMVPYFAGRYMALCAGLFGIILGVASLTERNDIFDREYGNQMCRSLWKEYSAFVLFSSFCSVVNVGIRAMAVWNLDSRVTIPLGLLLAGHLGLTIYSYLPESYGLLVILFYNPALDTIVFIFTACRIYFPRTRRKRAAILQRILQDGWVYFLILTCVNVFAVMGTGLLIGGIWVGALVVAILSSMISGRLVRRLSNFSKSAPALYLMTEDEFVYAPNRTIHVDLEKEPYSS